MTVFGPTVSQTQSRACSLFGFGNSSAPCIAIAERLAIAEKPAMTRRKAFLILLVLWAAIYLPGLGSTELKGEEGRRILPAVTMLETGNWLVPYVGGKPFLRKPPVMNWLIALSFKVTGVKNEWTARLPSVLAVLAMAATIVAFSGGVDSTSNGSRWLRPQTALVAAIMTMTTFGLLSKARFAGAEIEGVYVPLFGIAITCWLALSARAASPWLTWIIPFVFLGLGALAKGPLHILFFYGIVVTVHWTRKGLRALLHPAHFAGILVMSAIFASWAIPYSRPKRRAKPVRCGRTRWRIAWSRTASIGPAMPVISPAESGTCCRGYCLHR
jgi:4-amino-4-deoxy-L-arabinose transferase-like glycosyltransferase